ncbi:hypothetical protein AcW1_004541 [Taiwanofungus camphoratus]|nr:hypothetical protein AcW2_006453 [Antrodia cinnamomea]KAI0952452.1 hypothetical protein AcV7_008254 [Antrodia cinnamomea]KAI0959830.1 hypothetical protein AcW1_004541 [Antrodia cinnamomea]
MTRSRYYYRPPHPEQDDSTILLDNTTNIPEENAVPSLNVTTNGRDESPTVAVVATMLQVKSNPAEPTEMSEFRGWRPRGRANLQSAVYTGGSQSSASPVGTGTSTTVNTDQARQKSSGGDTKTRTTGAADGTKGQSSSQKTKK